MEDNDATEPDVDDITVRLRLDCTADGGRSRPVFNGARMPWNVGNIVDGEMMLNDASARRRRECGSRQRSTGTSSTLRSTFLAPRSAGHAHHSSPRGPKGGEAVILERRRQPRNRVTQQAPRPSHTARSGRSRACPQTPAIWVRTTSPGARVPLVTKPVAAFIPRSSRAHCAHRR